MLPEWSSSAATNASTSSQYLGGGEQDLVGEHQDHQHLFSKANKYHVISVDFAAHILFHVRIIDRNMWSPFPWLVSCVSFSS